MWVEMGFYLSYWAHCTMRHLELRLAHPKFINCHECEFQWPCTTLQHPIPFQWPCTTLQHPIPFLANNKSFTCIWSGPDIPKLHDVGVNGIPLNHYLTLCYWSINQYFSSTMVTLHCIVQHCFLLGTGSRCESIFHCSSLPNSNRRSVNESQCTFFKG